MRASNTVKGMEVASRKSDKARLKMKMFLAVLISFLLNTADITNMFPLTRKHNKVTDKYRKREQREHSNIEKKSKHQILYKF